MLLLLGNHLIFFINANLLGDISVLQETFETIYMNNMLYE